MKLEIIDINKSFGDAHILQDVSFTVESGKTMGFLGRNGAGKTTTIRALMGVFKADSGKFLVDGEPFVRADYKVGYLPEERGMYAKASLKRQLVYFGQLKNMAKKDAQKSADEWIDRFELGDYRNKPLETLSKGNQQKIQIAQAFIDDPDMVILDEPFSGLDPVNSQVLKEVIREFVDKKRLIIFSSHQMNYVEEFCDEIALIDHGRMVLTRNLEALKKEIGHNRLRLAVEGYDIEALFDRLQERKDITVSTDRRSVIVELDGGQTKEAFLRSLLDEGYRIDTFSHYTPSLEDIFIGKVGDGK